MIPITQLLNQLLTLGVRRGGILQVHTSFRAVGDVEGGPLGLISALQTALGPEGTLVMPTMTDGESVFDPKSTPTVDMGVVAELFWRQPNVLRSGHPGASFAACGPRAEYICAAQPLAPPHGPDSPVGRVHKSGGHVLLLGVTHSEDTMLHLAESIAGVPYSVSHPCVVEVEGLVQTVLIPETDHCCTRFRLADEWLRARGFQAEGKVGHAKARLCAAKDIVAVALEHLALDPLVFLCADSENCSQCRAARESVETLPHSTNRERLSAP